jgi:hypothetical protein
VNIQPLTPVVEFTRTPQGIHFETAAVIRNDGPGSIFLSECSPALQRKVEEGWATVWTPVCITGAIRREVPAGESVTVPVGVSAYSNPAIEPQLDPRLTAGTYRLLWDISTTPEVVTAKVLPESGSYSSTFELRER